MAITRVWQSGLESGSDDEMDITVGDFIIRTNNVNTGIYSMGDGNASNSYSQVNFSSTFKLRFGFFYYGNVSTSTAIRADFRNGTTRLFRMNAESDGSLSFYVPSTYRGSSPIGNLVQWKHIGIDIHFDASSGWIAVYTDGSENFSLTGLNTGASACDNVRFGKIGNLGTFITYWDDLYIDDTTGESSPTPLPIKRFYPLIPNGDGNYSQWTSSAVTGSHYEMVDERPPDDDTTYLEAVTGSLLDSFTMDTFTLDNNELIVAMIPFVFAKRGGITEQISLGTRSSGTDMLGSGQDLSTAYGYVWERQTTGSLGFDWNQSYMDSVEVLINSTGTY